MDSHREREVDNAYARRQLAGLHALTALGDPENTSAPFPGPAMRLRQSNGPKGPHELTSGQSSSSSGSTPTPNYWTKISRITRSDQMLRSSLYLILNYGLQAALGFAFWIIAARLFSTASVGRASLLFSAATFISFFGLLGFNVTFLRYLPITRQRSRLITAGVTLVAACSGVLALIYVLFTPIVARPISFVVHSLPLTLGFVILTAGVGVNSLTDSIFIAAGKANYNAFVDGIIGGISKIVLVLLLVGGGAYGIFGAASGGLMAAAISSLLLMAWRLRWRPKFKNFRQLLKPVFRFSGMNYVGSIMTLLPTLIVPVIVLNKIGASGAAYYYVAFQLANILYQAAYSVEQAFLVEGSHAGVISRAVLIRSARVLLALCIPAFIVVILCGHELLLAFGPKYGANADSSLIPLTAAVLPIAIGNWCLTILRLSNQLRAIVVSNLVYSVTIVGLAWLLASHGLGALSVAWPIGASAGAVVAGIAAVRTIRLKHRSSF